MTHTAHKGALHRVSHRCTVADQLKGLSGQQSASQPELAVYELFGKHCALHYCLLAPCIYSPLGKPKRICGEVLSLFERNRFGLLTYNLSSLTHATPEIPAVETSLKLQFHRIAVIIWHNPPAVEHLAALAIYNPQIQALNILRDTAEIHYKGRGTLAPLLPQPFAAGESE